MVLGIGYMELLIIAGGGVYLIGTKDLPRVARLAGRATGRAVTYISALRNRAFSFAEENELNKLHEEIQASMRQLNALRDEMRSGVHIFGQGQSRLNNISRNLQNMADHRNATEESSADAGQKAPPSTSGTSQEEVEDMFKRIYPPYRPTRRVVDYTTQSPSSRKDEDVHLKSHERVPKPD